MYFKKRFEAKNDSEIERSMDIIADIFLDRNMDDNKVDYLMSYYDDYIRTQLNAGKSPEEIADELDTDINPDEAKVDYPKDGEINTANAVRDFLATYLKNELEDSVDLDYAVRTYDDVYPYVEVVDKDMPDNGAYLTLYVYSPLGDGNFKIAYKYFEHPNNRIDCPTNVTGLEGVAKMFAMLVLGKSAVKESSGFDDYLAQFKEEFETQWGPYGWEKAYALILNTEDWLQEIKDNWANNDYDPAEMAEYAIETWFNDESKTEGASTYTFTWWDNAPAAERRPTTRADLRNSKHKETFTAKDDADALEQAVQFLLDEDGDDRDDYDSAEEVWDHFDFDWGSGSPIPMVLKQGRRVIKDSGFDPADDESKRKSESAEYTVYSMDPENGSVSKDGAYPTWKAAYDTLGDGGARVRGSSNNFVFDGKTLMQVYKYKNTGRTGKWSGNGYDVIWSTEISEDPKQYIRDHFTATNWTSCEFNEKSESSSEKLEYEKGHKNSKGEDAPWVIRSHTDGRILASFAKKDAAEQHLARMKNYADKN